MQLRVLVSILTSILLHLIFVGGILSLTEDHSAKPLQVELRGQAIGIDAGHAKIKSPLSERRLRSSPSRDSDIAVGGEKRLGSHFGSEEGQIGASNGLEVSDRELYKTELTQLINAHKFYPAAAKRMRQTGSVLVSFRIDRMGLIDQVTIVSPSPHERLNAAASQLISSIRKFKPLPQSVRTDSLTVTVPVDYALF